MIIEATERAFEVFDEKAARLFDRKTFNPSNPLHAQILTALRSIGRARAHSYRHGYGNGVRRGSHDNNHQKCCASTALRNLALAEMKESKKVVDIGCGDSVDILIARGMGYETYGIDLFPPSVPLDGFIQGDVVDGLPFRESSIYAVISQAMIDLVEPADRFILYKEILRVLEPNGVFSQLGQSLKSGHGFNHRQEVERVREAGFRAIGVLNAGFVAVK